MYTNHIASHKSSKYGLSTETNNYYKKRNYYLY